MDFTSIPLTSHSAPIDEYIVLWTADKHKKLKKWHDGYMRYHTFNKRLMVYDHLMNKVCDKFLPESEQMDVGDELIFDSHLVTIEDVKGRQTQDLRPLFEKTVDRRRERGATSTPVRTVGTPGASTQSPTPTLLRSIPSRPTMGRGRPIYPSPTTKSIPQKSPEPPVAVPQKRNSQGAPVVQKINYKPLKVSRVEDNRPVPSYTRTDVLSSSILKNRNPRTSAEPPEIGLATNLTDADDDIEMLELDLERGDFAARPKPSARARPNAPLPFKPPRPQKIRICADTARQSESNDRALPLAHPPEPTGVPVSQATHPLCSSPRIPPSTITNYSQELFSSPSARKKSKGPPFRVQEDSNVHASSPVKSPPHIQSPDPTPKEKVNEPGRLTLPSATSRNRRKLLCGPAGRGNTGSKMVSLSRPVSTLSILNTFSKDDGPPAPGGRREHGKGPLNKAGLGGSPKPNALEEHEKPAIQKTSAVRENTPNHSGPGKPGINKLDTHWKPLWDYNGDSGGSPGSGKQRQLDTAEIQSSERYTKPNEKQGKDSALCIFSSDEEDLEPIVAKQNSKRLRPVSPGSDSSFDEFEPMRSSAVPKHLVGQSRNAKLQLRQRVPEASRIWREGDSVD
ncbi:hypothetical protein TWF730_003152 [Orbilia blumenaviensis]|uniref:5'-3' DNA helicase ZGRF1-like N-terminal domain-containing protein n=1 Tax=Orbilia blumenaviensis TaxID=1796055 RepID=A0AAV9U4Q1_9PEZI